MQTYVKNLRLPIKIYGHITFYDCQMYFPCNSLVAVKLLIAWYYRRLLPRRRGLFSSQSAFVWETEIAGAGAALKPAGQDYQLSEQGLKVTRRNIGSSGGPRFSKTTLPCSLSNGRSRKLNWGKDPGYWTQTGARHQKPKRINDL